MSSSINASGGRNAYYQRLSTQQTSAARQTSATQQTSPSQRTSGAPDAAEARAPQQAEPAASAQAAQSADGLSASERTMIARQFPETPDLSMRLYGPGRSAQTVHPDALGSRLDVQG